MLLRGPMRMAGEEPSQKTKLIDEKEPEANTDYSRRDAEDAADARETVSCKGEGHGHGRGHAHHTHHGARAKNQEVDRRPEGTVDG